MPLTNIIPLLSGLELNPAGFPHGSNLHTKSHNEMSESKIFALVQLIPAYLLWHTSATKYEEGSANLTELISAAESYSSVIQRLNVFSHQSDFSSSLLPEIICFLLRKIIKDLPGEKTGLIVAAQKKFDN